MLFLFISCLSTVIVGCFPILNYAYGCDSFGYLRQAQLFRQNGVLRGIDTRVLNEEAQFLIRTAKSVGLDPDEFSEMVAPHAHHYNRATDHVILQYPPGAGLLLSFLPEHLDTQIMTVVVASMISLVFVLIGARSLHSPLDVAALSAVLLMLQQLVVDSGGSYSFTWTIGLIPIAALAALRITAGGRATRWVLGFVLGLACGLLLVTRIPNVFVVCGIALFVFLNSLFEREAASKQMLPILIAAGVVFTVCGVAPLLAANRLNAGHFFATTYSPIDASPPELKWKLIWHNIVFYYRDTYAWPIALLALAMVVASVLSVFSTRRTEQRHATLAISVAVSMTFFLTLAYFSTHEVTTPYYIAPGCTFAVCLGLFGFLEGRRSATTPVPKHNSGRDAVALISIGIVLAIQILRLGPNIIRPSVPPEVVNPSSIVWADLTSGTLLYYNGKYAAKLGFGSACAQARMIQAVYDSGRPQYFIADSDTMAKIVEGLSNLADLEITGIYDAAPAPAKIYRLVKLKNRLTC